MTFTFRSKLWGGLYLLFVSFFLELQSSSAFMTTGPSYEMKSGINNKFHGVNERIAAGNIHKKINLSQPGHGKETSPLYLSRNFLSSPTKVSSPIYRQNILNHRNQKYRPHHAHPIAFGPESSKLTINSMLQVIPNYLKFRTQYNVIDMMNKPILQSGVAGIKNNILPMAFARTLQGVNMPLILLAGACFNMSLVLTVFYSFLQVYEIAIIFRYLMNMWPVFNPYDYPATYAFVIMTEPLFNIMNKSSLRIGGMLATPFFILLIYEQVVSWTYMLLKYLIRLAIRLHRMSLVTNNFDIAEAVVSPIFKRVF